MKTLVILKAKPNHGKTQTLNFMIKSLCEDPEFSIIYPSSKDEIGAFVIGRYKTHTIGIITFGDPGYDEELTECLDQCIQEKCDIIFSASRTKWSIYDMLRAFAKNHNAAIIETSPLYIHENSEHNVCLDILKKLSSEILLNLINELPK